MGKIQISNRKESSKSGIRLGIIKQEISAWILIVPTLIILFFWSVRPIFTGVLYSFFDMKGYELTNWIGLDNYKIILSDTMFVPTLINTIKYVVWSLLLGYIPPLFVALMLNEMVHGQGFFKVTIYFPVMVSAIATAMIWNYLYQPDANGLLNMLLAKVGVEPQVWLQNKNYTIPLIIVSSTWQGFGGTMVMYLAALQGINQELYEAAFIDGASYFRRIWNITLPSIKNILLLFGVRQMIGVFQIMAEPLAMTGGGPDGASMSLGLWSYSNAFVYFKPQLSLAIGVIMFVILMILTFFYFKLQNNLDTE